MRGWWRRWHDTGITMVCGDGCWCVWWANGLVDNWRNEWYNGARRRTRGRRRMGSGEDNMIRIRSCVAWCQGPYELMCSIIVRANGPNVNMCQRIILANGSQWHNGPTAHGTADYVSNPTQRIGRMTPATKPLTKRYIRWGLKRPKTYDLVNYLLKSILTQISFRYRVYVGL